MALIARGGGPGRLLQVHNLPQNKIPDIELARELVREKDFETLELLFGETPFIFSQLVRTALIAQHNFIISDFSAIEARVVAWLADEQWVLETFKGDGKLYERTASRMFNVPVEKIAKGQPEYELRQKGKIATLSCSYGGSVGALTSMGALKMGLVEEELSDIVRAWRQANPNIVRLWYDTEKAVKDALDTGWQVAIAKGVSAELEQGTLFIALPSGRRLAYAEVALEDNEITYMGIDQQSKKWTKLRTYGAKLVENITQAIARDCLAEAMKRLDQAGYSIVIHVHDEVVIDTDKDAMADITEMMSRDIDWVPGLPLRGDTYQTKFYKKD